MVGNAYRPGGVLARELASCRADHSRLELPDGHRSRRRADLLLQRRVHSARGRLPTPCRARTAGTGGLEGNLERDPVTPLHPHAHHWRPDRRSRSADAPRAQRLPGRNLPHILVRRPPGRQEPAERHFLHGHREYGTHHRRAADQLPAGAGRAQLVGRDAGGRVSVCRCDPGGQPPRSALRPALSIG